MPDGDLVRFGVSRAYSTAYKELCEGYFSDEHIAGKIAKGLCQSLKRYGNAPIKLANQVSDAIADHVSKGRAVSFMDESQLIDEQALELRGHRRGTPLAVDAAKEYAMQVANSEPVAMNAIPIIRGYVSRAFTADFLESFPLLSHHNGVDPEFVEKRLENIRPYLDREIERIVSQIAKSGGVDTLRKKPRDKASAANFESWDISMPSELQGD